MNKRRKSTRTRNLESNGHKVAIQNRQGNRLDRLKMEDGIIAETKEELETTLNPYFPNLMQEPEEDREES